MSHLSRVHARVALGRRLHLLPWNLVRGQGLEFNAGERVEGQTNLPWTLLLAGAMALGICLAHRAEILARQRWWLVQAEATEEEPCRIARAGTFANKKTKPSAAVGCVKIASRNTV